VKGIVEAHGGSVTVQSVHGQGSTFVVHLPTYRGEPSPAVPGTSQQAASSAFSAQH
jgi:K+-sensing histidine kinase KdpD